MTTIRSRIARRVVPLLAAVAVATGGLAPAPARADADLARLLAGAAGLAIIIGIAEQSRRSRAHAAPAPVHIPQAHPPRHEPRHEPRHGQAQHWQHQRPTLLPARCGVELSGRGRGAETLYGARCLAREGIDLERLPRRCAVEVHGRQGLRRAYSGDCLVRAGFREQHAGHWR